MAEHRFARREGDRHLISHDIGPLRMAKANVTGDDIDRMKAVGVAVFTAMTACKWGVKELAAKVGRDEAEVSRWLSGVRRPQFDLLFSIDEMQEPLVLALADVLAPGKFTKRTTLETRRSA